MKITLNAKNNWTMHGVQTILDQLGVSYGTENNPGESGIFITDADSPLPANTVGIIIGTPAGRVKELDNVFLIFKDAKAYFPGKVTIPEDTESFEIISSFDTGDPGIIRDGNKIYILPNFFEHIARLTTLRTYDETYAETFSWDEFRQIFMCILEYIADYLNRPLARLWYYPSVDHKNSITYTTDIDHRLTWEILKGLKRWTAIRAALAGAVPFRILQLFALAAAHRYYGTGRFDRKYLGPGHVLLGRLLSRLRAALPLSFYFASILRPYSKSIPITAFVRPSRFQKEEDPDTYPFRQSYEPSELDGIETGLHFGATIGRTHHEGELIDNPYKENPFKDGIIKQLECLKENLKKNRFGSRLHHIFGFNQEMFYHLNRREEILYDSSIFGTVGDVSTCLNPAGVSLPYFPVLLADKNAAGNRARAEFVERPVAAYETPDLL